MKLLDQIRRAGRFGMPHWVLPEKREDWARHAARLDEFLRDPLLPAILIDNVADYYYTGTDQEYWDFGQHFPNLAPPFECFWMEYRTPRRIHSTQGDTETGIHDGRAGWLLFGAPREQVTGEGIPENVRWIIAGELFIHYGDRGHIVGPHGTWNIALDSEGRIVEVPWLQSWGGAEEDQVLQCIFALSHVPMLAICFLHCKNVSVEAEPVHPKHAKAVRKLHGIEPVRFKRLIIEPLKQILRREGGAAARPCRPRDRSRGHGSA